MLAPLPSVPLARCGTVVGERRHLSDLITVSWVDDGHPALGAVLRVGEDGVAAAFADRYGNRNRPDSAGIDGPSERRPWWKCQASAGLSADVHRRVVQLDFERGAAGHLVGSDSTSSNSSCRAQDVGRVRLRAHQANMQPDRVPLASRSELPIVRHHGHAAIDRIDHDLIVGGRHSAAEIDLGGSDDIVPRLRSSEATAWSTSSSTNSTTHLRRSASRPPGHSHSARERLQDPLIRQTALEVGFDSGDRYPRTGEHRLCCRATTTPLDMADLVLTARSQPTAGAARRRVSPSRVGSRSAIGPPSTPARHPGDDGTAGGVCRAAARSRRK